MRYACALSIALVFALAPLHPAASEEPTLLDTVTSREPERCVLTHHFRSTAVIDRDHVLFEGRRGRAWVNKLHNSCASLRRTDRFSFDHAERRICNQDWVGAVDRMAPPTAVRARCLLGSFYRVSEEEANRLRDAD